jgi:hypothetical protein
MFLDRSKYTESAYIGEELLADGQSDRLHKCMVVEQTVTDGDFSMDEALEVYEVSREEYEEFLAKKYNYDIKASFSGASESESYIMYIQVVDRMLNGYFNARYQKQVKAIRKKLRDMSHDIEQEKENA